MTSRSVNLEKEKKREPSFLTRAGQEGLLPLLPVSYPRGL